MAITTNWGKIYCSSDFGDESNKRTVQNVFTDVCTPVTTGLNLLATYTGEDGLGARVWQQVSLDITAYSGYNAYLVFHYENTGSLGDVQLDTIELSTTGGVQSRTFATGTGMTTNSNQTSDYNSVTFTNLTTESGNPLYDGKFVRRQGVGDTANTATASGFDSGAGDGYMTYFLSASATRNGWLRMDNTYTIGNSSPTLSFDLARKGTDIGTLKVYLDIQ